MMEYGGNLGWIKDIIYFLPVLALVWKAAIQSAQISTNTKDIADLKDVVKTQNKEILASLEAIRTTITAIQIDLAEMKSNVKSKDV